MRELHARIGAQLRIRQLDQAVARAERMATLGTTAAGLAHEVRNALNPIVGGLEVLDKVEDELEREELKQHMGAAAQRILDTIEAMQAFVRMGDAQLTSLDLDQAVQDSRKLLAHRLQGFTVECDLSLDQPVECFSGTLHQVLMNLLVNAVDAAGEDGSIWIATRRSGENALFSVRDSGPGIPAAERARIFFPYYTTKPVGHGTGMGLSISRSIVERHGGTIAVTSPPNQGAEITVEIPLKLKE